MNSFDAVQAASSALSKIGESGFTVEATTDFDVVPNIADTVGKPHLTPLLDPSNHDFSAQTAFWLILKDEVGNPAGCVGARLEDLRNDEIDDFWRRSFSRHYPDAGSIDITLSRSARDVLAGRLAYIGDLYMAAPTGGLGGASGNRLSCFLHLMHALVALEWKVNAAYSFISAKDALRGAGTQYGYTLQLPRQKGWKGQPPKNRYDDEWLIILPSTDRAAAFRQQVSSNS